MTDHNKLHSFVPSLLEPGFALMVVSVSTCAHCKRTMLPTPGKEYWDSIFPAYFIITREKQMQSAGWVAQAYAFNESGNKLCVECAVEHARFTCSGCQQVRQGNPKESFGYRDSGGADYLCTSCYETMPAKQWDELEKKLREEHKYDDC